MNFLFSLSILQSLFFTLLATENGDIRLLKIDENEKSIYGLLQLYEAGAFGTICDNNANWDLTNTLIVCKELINSLVGWHEVKRTAGIGNVKTYRYNVSCNGTEESFNTCSYYSPPLSCDGHEYDVYIGCMKPIESSEKVFHLEKIYSDDYLTKGRVEILYNGYLHDIRAESLTNRDARTICKDAIGAQYGILMNQSVYVDGYLGEGFGPVLKSMNCSDEIPENCKFEAFRNLSDSYNHINDAFVICVNSHSTDSDSDSNDEYFLFVVILCIVIFILLLLLIVCVIAIVMLLRKHNVDDELPIDDSDPRDKIRIKELPKTPGTSNDLPKNKPTIAETNLDKKKEPVAKKPIVNGVKTPFAGSSGGPPVPRRTFEDNPDENYVNPEDAEDLYNCPDSD